MAKIVDNGFAPDHGISLPSDLWSEILPSLWLGGTDDFDTIDYEHPLNNSRAITKDDFDLVVTLYAWAAPVDWFVREIRYGFYDSSDSIKTEELDNIFSLASQAYEAWKRGERVLIRCQAGINRSSLVMGIVLMLDGYSAADAIELMRTKRSEWVLSNQSFEEFLLKIDKVGGIRAHIK